MSELDALAYKLQAVQREFDGPAYQARLLEVARKLAPDVEPAVRRTPAQRGSLADASMSRWMRGNPVVIRGEARIGVDGVEVKPVNKAAGPMRVLQDGRSAYTAGDRRNSGTYTSKKTGLTKQKTRKVKRTTGAAGGKGTWSAFTEGAVGKVPRLADLELQMAIGKHIGRG